jgi:hypothetical protein
MDNAEIWQMLEKEGLLCKRLIMQKKMKNKSSRGEDEKKRGISTRKARKQNNRRK